MKSRDGGDIKQEQNMLSRPGSHLISSSMLATKGKGGVAAYRALWCKRMAAYLALEDNLEVSEMVLGRCSSISCVSVNRRSRQTHSLQWILLLGGDLMICLLTMKWGVVGLVLRKTNCKKVK